MIVYFRNAVLVLVGHRAHQKRKTRGGSIPGVPQRHYAYQDGGVADMWVVW